jgi:hypothetical protein
MEIQPSARAAGTATTAGGAVWEPSSLAGGQVCLYRYYDYIMKSIIF